MTLSVPPALRRERLRDALPSSIDLLWRSWACEVPSGYLEDYVALRWLEWHTGGWRMTSTGETVRREVVDRVSLP